MANVQVEYPGVLKPPDQDRPPKNLPTDKKRTQLLGQRSAF